MAFNVNSLYPTGMTLLDLSSVDADYTNAANAQPIGFYVGGTGGNVVLTTVRGDVITLPVLANTFYPIPFKLIAKTSSGTSATPIFALFG